MTKDTSRDRVTIAVLALLDDPDGGDRYGKVRLDHVIDAAGSGAPSRRTTRDVLATLVKYDVLSRSQDYRGAYWSAGPGARRPADVLRDDQESAPPLKQAIAALDDVDIPGNGGRESVRREALATVLEYLDEEGPTSLADLAEAVHGEHAAGYDDVFGFKKGLLGKVLPQLVERGVVERPKRGIYAIAD